MKYYFFLLIAVILLALDFALNKVYQRRAGTSPKAGFKFNALMGLFAAAIFLVGNGFKLHFSLYSLLLATCFSLTVMLYNLCGFRIMKQGSMALYTLFLMSGGMLLPYICGLAFWGEPFSIWRTVGLVVILAAVVLSNSDSGKIDKKILFLCCAVFLLNGLTSICSKLNQMETGLTTVDSTEFVIYTGLTKFVMAGLGYLFSKKDEQFSACAKKGPIWPLILFAATIDGISYFLQLLGTANLPATVLFPFVTGGTMVFSALAGILFFKERPSKQVLLGVALSFIGTLLFL